MTFRLDPIKAMVHRSFPEVASITTGQLAAKIEGGASVVLLDVRTPEEYRVSHLPGAMRVDPNARAVDVAVDPAAEVVAYCSVGWRSARLARRLATVGVNVVNLEGSIFEWVAKGLPVVDDRGVPVRVVHPFSRSWAWLVDPSLRRFG
jgi:rhodanese-related sulfurtransferase